MKKAVSVLKVNIKKLELFKKKVFMNFTIKSAKIFLNGLNIC